MDFFILNLLCNIFIIIFHCRKWFQWVKSQLNKILKGKLISLLSQSYWLYDFDLLSELYRKKNLH